MKRFQILSHQRGLLFRDAQLIAVLSTGLHRYWDLANRLTLQLVDLNQWHITDPDLVRLYQQHPLLQDHIRRISITPDQVGLLLLNDQLCGLIPPGEQIYLWQQAGNFALQTVPLTTTALPEALRTLLLQNGSEPPELLLSCQQRNRPAALLHVFVDQSRQGLLYIDGVLQQVLAPGSYAFWQLQHQVDIRLIDLRLQPMEISGQEILSKDRVSLRLNLSLMWRFIDPLLAVQQLDKPADYCYKLVQLALREVVGGKTLDELLLDKQQLVQTIQQLTGPSLLAAGMELQQIGVKDIILPGDMKQILNQVVEAQKAAEANVIKRREETNATRSLLNTAKVMENNPVLIRLKELEALEKVAEKIQNLNLYGGLDQLMQGVVKLA